MTNDSFILVLDDLLLPSEKRCVYSIPVNLMVGLKMKTRLKIAFRPKGCSMNNKWFIYSGPTQSFVALGDKSVYVNLVCSRFEIFKIKTENCFQYNGLHNEWKILQYYFVAFCSFFPCSLTVFHRGTQWKSSRADKQHCFS